MREPNYKLQKFSPSKVFIVYGISAYTLVHYEERDIIIFETLDLHVGFSSTTLSLYKQGSNKLLVIP